MSDDLSLDLFGEEEGSDGAGDVHEEPRAAPPEPLRPKVWSVSQVNRAVRGLLEESVQALWVGGEIGGWNRSRAGHCYFTLKDDRAQLRCVIFSREASLLPADPEEGMQVRAFGELTLYEARGDYQLVARRVEPEGADGLWRLAFEKLRAKLEAEGLLAAERKRPLPRFPACVGVVTSLGGAALHDILTVLSRRAPWTRVVVRGTRVQGEGAAEEIAHALRALAECGACDVIIVGRGGGAVEDLWAFNEEPVARAIAACPVPVVSAVGHEIDGTISDLVADLRAPTPSAAAEAVVPDREAVLEALRRVPEQLGRALRRGVERRQTVVADRLRRLERVMDRRFGPARQALDRSVAGLERGARGAVKRRRLALASVSGRLDALSPLATLQRGYSVARTPAGAVLKSTSDLPAGLAFHLRVTDGTVEATSRGPLDAHVQEEVPGGA
ncbi:MAG TPA: exodeoxyribonuclease VII large subunit [Longimicrobiales bacterium]|nr:exodeoxyribonuclease VII large subunit [Longimicrobiales bacterium]